MESKLDFIWRRKSVRSFKNEPVTSEQLEELLKAGMAGPSACRKDPWEFIVLDSEASRKAVSQCLPNGPFLADAPLGIIICGNLKKAHGCEESFMLQDCSGAIENMLLAAAALGLGGCWLGIHPRRERIDAIKKLFGLADEIVPVGAIALGTPVTEPEPGCRYDASKVRFAQEIIDGRH